MSKKLLVLAVLAIGVAGRSYCGGEQTSAEKLQTAENTLAGLKAQERVLADLGADLREGFLGNLGYEGDMEARREAFNKAVTEAEAVLKAAKEVVDNEAIDADKAARAAWFKGEQSRFQRPVRAGLRWASNPLNNVPFVKCAHGRYPLVVETVAVMASGAVLYKTGIFGWVRRNIVNRIPVLGVDAEEAEEATDAA